MKKGAIFDMDCLLVDTERIWQKTWKEIAADRGVDLDPAFTAAISGTSGDGACAVCQKYYHTDRETGRKIFEEALRRGTEKLKKQVPAKPGAREMLSWLKEKKTRIAVASSSPEPLIRSNLKLAGLATYMDVIVSGAGLPHGKPAPDVFLLAADRLELSPADCYVFEDSFNGIRAAHAAGCTAVMIPDLIEPDAEMKHLADGIFPSLSEALRAIRLSVL